MSIRRFIHASRFNHKGWVLICCRDVVLGRAVRKQSGVKLCFREGYKQKAIDIRNYQFSRNKNSNHLKNKLSILFNKNNHYQTFLNVITLSPSYQNNPTNKPNSSIPTKTLNFNSANTHQNPLIPFPLHQRTWKNPSNYQQQVQNNPKTIYIKTFTTVQ